MDPYDEFRYQANQMRKTLEELEEAFDTHYEPESMHRRRRHQIAEARGYARDSADESADEKFERQNQVARKTRNMEDYFYPFSSTKSKTFERASKIFEEANQSEKLTLNENDELLNSHKEDFSEYLDYLDKKGDVELSASSFESATIFKDGKTVTVTKHSKLQPDGTVKTEINQEVMDKSGKKDNRKWVKEDTLRKSLGSKETKEQESKQKQEEKEQAKKQEEKEQARSQEESSLGI